MAASVAKAKHHLQVQVLHIKYMIVMVHLPGTLFGHLLLFGIIFINYPARDGAVERSPRHQCREIGALSRRWSVLVLRNGYNASSCTCPRTTVAMSAVCNWWVIVVKSL